MRYAVFLTADAARDLEELHGYVVRHDAPARGVAVKPQLKRPLEVL